MVFGGWALFTGVSNILAARQASVEGINRGPVTTMGGTMAVVGLVLVIWPGTGVVSISWIVALAALLFAAALDLPSATPQTAQETGRQTLAAAIRGVGHHNRTIVNPYEPQALRKEFPSAFFSPRESRTTPTSDAMEYVAALANLDAVRRRQLLDGDWNVGAIAASGRPGALELVRKIILASASIPSAFPPVMIDVEAGG